MLHCPGTIVRTIVYSGVILATGLDSALAADPTGDWRVADGVANIRVAQCNGSMWGAVSWEKTPGGKRQEQSGCLQAEPADAGHADPDRHEEEARRRSWEGQVYNAKDGQLYSSTIKPVGTDQLEIKGCVLGFLCGGETWTRVGPPIPSSPANSMAKGAPKATGAAPKTAAPAPRRRRRRPPVRSTRAGAEGRARQKQAAGAAGRPAVGDICLLPDIARFAH